MNLKVKVCGMKDPGNIRELSALPVDYIGFIFYEQSPRYVGNIDLREMKIPPSMRKTGVFVNETPEKMRSLIQKHALDAVQLHGNESPETCRYMQQQGVQVIKAFSIEKREDIAQCAPYAGACEYFLFDTKTPQHGGSGVQFDWDVLQYYQEHVPFFLSGGIGADDAGRLRAFHHKSCCGVDLNSRFEIHAGYKDIALLKQYLNTLKKQ